MALTLSKEGFTHMVADGNDFAGNPLTAEKALAFNLFTDLVAAGFQIVATDTGNSLTEKTRKIILRPTAVVDPLAANVNDRWHVYFEVYTGVSAARAVLNNPVTGNDVTMPDTGLYFKVGSEDQLKDIANVSTSLPYYPIVRSNFANYLTAEQRTYAGIGSAEWPRISIKTPMAYHLTVAERGFALMCWTQVLTEDMYHMGTVCIQRGVGCDGNMVVTGQKPLYMVTNVAPQGYQFDSLPDTMGSAIPHWFGLIVRETDTAVTMPRWEGSTQISGPDGFRYYPAFISDPNEPTGKVLNYFPIRWHTPVTTDTGEYVLIFPFGICSTRFAFADEIDLIAVSKADAFQASQQVPITVYGEARKYTARNSNNQWSAIAGNGGTRIFILSGGPEFETGV